MSRCVSGETHPFIALRNWDSLPEHQMGYYDTLENVEEYIRMAEGFDGRELVDALRKHLPNNATVLELGMGPGKDLEILSESFHVTGSDSSQVFIERYRKRHPEADLMVLDAVSMDTDRRFDAVYSNKVLQHLTRANLERSLHLQAAVLNNNGVLLHSFWYGDKEETFSRLRFVCYTEESFGKLIGDEYDVVKSKRYTEMEADDSIYFVLAKRARQQ
jgi:trans-aconitate methyltransferase